MANGARTTRKKTSSTTYKWLDELDRHLYYYDEKRANRIINFMERFCRNPKSGKLFKLLEWQKDPLREFYGVLKKGTPHRKAQTLYLEVPKKNGKTGLLQGLNLYQTGADGARAAACS